MNPLERITPSLQLKAQPELVASTYHWSPTPVHQSFDCTGPAVGS